MRRRANAFTNYLVWWTLDKAIEYSAQLENEKPKLYTKLDEKLGLGALCPRWAEQVNQIFLTQPNEDGVLPQDSTFSTTCFPPRVWRSGLSRSHSATGC